MKFTFEVKETLLQIVEECKNSNSELEWVYVEHEGKFYLKDPNFYSSCEGEWLTPNKLKFTTAWSGFTYIVEEVNEVTFVTYEGAYLGLLQQALMPLLTPLFKGNENVESSYGNMPLVLYCKRQEKERRLKIDQGLVWYVHPYCLRSVTISNDLSEKERENLEKWSKINPIFKEILKERENTYTFSL